ncbi:hypothetical protein ACOMCU_05295 [Lysinibacillus sp. UGB7]
MTIFIFGISLLGMMAGVASLILGLIIRKKLKGGIVLGVSVVLFFVSLMMPTPEGSKEKIDVVSNTQRELIQIMARFWNKKRSCISTQDL